MRRDSDDITVMAFDYGTQRIGVAVGQTVSDTATALDVLPASKNDVLWRAITTQVDEWKPDLFVVGMPGHSDQRAHKLTPAIERFARRLRGRFSRPVEFIDERLSSYAAKTDAGASSRGIDADAAKSILLSWLEQSSTQRSVLNP